jgi:hypothetical protein
MTALALGVLGAILWDLFKIAFIRVWVAAWHE